MMHSGYCRVENGSIYYEDVGEGEAILFIHGFTLDHRMWREQVEYFKDRFRVITLDLRGFGKSSLPSSPYSYSDDIKEVLDFLKVGQIHLVGLSLGGEEALNFALQYPQYLISLTLVSSSLGGYSSTVNWDVGAEAGLEIAKENWLKHAVFESTNMYPTAKQELKKMVDDYSGWHWINSGYRLKPSEVAIERLDKLNTSVLVIIGELDLQYYHDIARIFTKKIKQIKITEFSKCGHMLNMENPSLFNKSLDSFIASTRNQ